MDWKCSSSGMKHMMDAANLEKLQTKDVLKFVVGSQEDMNEMLDVLNNYHIKAQVYISPIFGQIEMSEIVDFMKDHCLVDAKLQCQLHKIIWDPNKRGV